MPYGWLVCYLDSLCAEWILCVPYGWLVCYLDTLFAGWIFVCRMIGLCITWIVCVLEEFWCAVCMACVLYELLGEMQRIAFRLMLPSCVCLCVCMPRLWTSEKRFEIETLPCRIPKVVRTDI